MIKSYENPCLCGGGRSFEWHVIFSAFDSEMINDQFPDVLKDDIWKNIWKRPHDVDKIHREDLRSFQYPQDGSEI